MQKENYSSFFETVAIVHQVVDADVTGATVDTRGYQSLTFNISFGEISSVSFASYWTIRMMHTDASALGAGPSDYANVEGSHVIGSGMSLAHVLTSGILFSVDGSSLSGTVTAYGYRGDKRYVRLMIEEEGNLSTLGIAATARLGHGSNWPATGGVDVTL
jgi:hypothetical protein